MKKYQVCVTMTTSVDIYVKIEANNEDEAIVQAENLALDGQYSDQFADMEAKGLYGVEFKAYNV